MVCRSRLTGKGSSCDVIRQNHHGNYDKLNINFFSIGDATHLVTYSFTFFNSTEIKSIIIMLSSISQLKCSFSCYFNYVFRVMIYTIIHIWEGYIYTHDHMTKCIKITIVGWRFIICGAYVWIYWEKVKQEATGQLVPASNKSTKVQKCQIKTSLLRIVLQHNFSYLI